MRPQDTLVKRSSLMDASFCTYTPEGGEMVRPATGKTKLRNVRVPDELWSDAMTEARAEGRTLTDVIVGDLHRYVTRRRRERGALDSEPQPSSESDNHPK